MSQFWRDDEMGKYKPPAERRFGKGVQLCKRCGSRDSVIQSMVYIYVDSALEK